MRGFCSVYAVSEENTLMYTYAEPLSLKRRRSFTIRARGTSTGKNDFEFKHKSKSYDCVYGSTGDRVLSRVYRPSASYVEIEIIISGSGRLFVDITAFLSFFMFYPPHTAPTIRVCTMIANLR